MPVRTRFAPSPTGYMHIGGMRTALFNWLWARHNNGQFVLRIDDTDRVRNVEAALQPILEAFRWLGLDWDEGPDVGGPHGPYFQSQRGDAYRAAAERLLASGRAYRDYDTPEQIKVDRQAAERDKTQYLNIRRALELTTAQRQALEAEGRPFVVRLIVPRDATIVVDDLVRGHVEWDCGLISDPVLIRGDGSPLYNFATVVDDADFEISHVIRAEEHLTNTAVQLLIGQALEARTPQFAHIPFVAAPGSTRKLSKRELGKYRTNPQFRRLFDTADAVLPALGLAADETLNPVMVAFYERVGFLPESVLNALARLGWSLDDKTEFMSREFLVRHFTLDRVVKGSAGLDPDKLFAYQEHWMAQVPLSERVQQCLPYLAQAGLVSADPAPETLNFILRLLTALGDRIKLFSDIIGYGEYFVADDRLAYDEKAFDKRIRHADQAQPLLAEYRAALSAAEPFQAAELDRHMHLFVADRGRQIGDLIHAVRVAVTGKPAGPGLFDCLELLGRDACQERIRLALERAN